MDLLDELKGNVANGAHGGGKKREAVYDRGEQVNNKTTANYVPKVGVAYCILSVKLIIFVSLRLFRSQIELRSYLTVL